MVKGSRIWVFSLLLMVTVILAGCGAGGAVTAPASGAVDLPTQKVPVEGGGSYTDVNAAGLAVMLEDKDFPLINVHVPYEGEIPDTDLFIPYNEVEANLGQLPLDKGAKALLYCRSGVRSADGLWILNANGYNKVFNMLGGIIEWKEKGYSIVR